MNIKSRDLAAGAFFAFLAFVPGVTIAQQSQGAGDNTCDYRQELANRESYGGKYDATNGSYHGKYQFGKLAFIDTGYQRKDGSWTGKDGINSLADWYANPQVQENAQAAFMNKQDSYSAGLQKYVGQPIPGCGKALTQDGLRGAVHLVGTGGVQAFFNSGGQCGQKGKGGLSHSSVDGNGTCAGDRMCAMSGCSTIEKDMSKQTCQVTMPMIEAISCSNFPAGLQSFCQATRPHLMTRAECSSAESWAERAPKGPNKDACEHLTFAPGTGSWAFTLACSYAKEAPADQDGQPNPRGPVADPQCIERLRGMGVEFDSLGQMQNGSYGGKACVIENAVSLRGTAVPFGAKLTMTCDMAIAMEQFGQQMRGLGVTGYYGIGSTRTCGPMRDAGGNKPGTITEHALGRAVDISGFTIGGRKVSFGAIHQPSTADGALATTAKSLACSSFRGVLSPTYSGYVGTFVHFHVEWGAFSGCR